MEHMAKSKAFNSRYYPKYTLYTMSVNVTKRTQKGRVTHHLDRLLVMRLRCIRRGNKGGHVCHELKCVLIYIPKKDGRDSTTVWFRERDCVGKEKGEPTLCARAQSDMSNGRYLLVSSFVFGSKLQT
jgi:hypothetical protein